MCLNEEFYLYQETYGIPQYLKKFEDGASGVAMRCFAFKEKVPFNGNSKILSVGLGSIHGELEDKKFSNCNTLINEKTDKNRKRRDPRCVRSSTYILRPLPK